MTDSTPQQEDSSISDEIELSVEVSEPSQGEEGKGTLLSAATPSAQLSPMETASPQQQESLEENSLVLSALKEELAEMKMKLAATNLILSRKDQELVKTMKREEVQIKKLRAHIQRTKEVQERRNNTLEVLFQLAVQQDIPTAELHARFREAYVAYEDTTMKHLRKEAGAMELDDVHRQVIEDSVDSLEHERADENEKARLKEEFSDPNRVEELKETYDIKHYLRAADLSREFQMHFDSNGLPTDAFSPSSISTPRSPRRTPNAQDKQHRYDSSTPMLNTVLQKEANANVKDTHVTENGRKYKIQLRRKIELSDSNIQTDPMDITDPEVRIHLYKQQQRTQNTQTVDFDVDADIDFVKKQTNYSEELKKIQEKYSKLTSNSRYRDQLASDTGFMLHNAKIIDMLNTSIDIILNPQDEKKTTESLKMVEGLYKKVAIILCQVSPKYNRKKDTLKWIKLQQKYLRDNVNEMRNQMQQFDAFIKEVSAQYLQEVDRVTNDWIEQQKEMHAEKERQLQVKEEVLRMKEEAFAQRLEKLKADEADYQMRAKKNREEKESLQKMKKQQAAEQKRLSDREQRLEEQLKDFKDAKDRILKLEIDCKQATVTVKNERVMIEQLLRDQRTEEKRLREERTHHATLIKELQEERKQHGESIRSMKEERDLLAALKRQHSMSITTENISTQTPGSYTCTQEVQTVGAKLITAEEVRDLLRTYSKCRQQLSEQSSEVTKLKKTLSGQKLRQSKADEKSRYQKQVMTLLQQNIDEVKQKMQSFSEMKSVAKRSLLRLLPEIRFLMGSSRHEVEEYLENDGALDSPTDTINNRTRRSHTVTTGAPARFVEQEVAGSEKRPSSTQPVARRQHSDDDDTSVASSVPDEPSPLAIAHKRDRRKHNAMFSAANGDMHEHSGTDDEMEHVAESMGFAKGTFGGSLRALETHLFGHLYLYSFPSDVFRNLSSILRQFRGNVVDRKPAAHRDGVGRLKQSSMIRQVHSPLNYQDEIASPSSDNGRRPDSRVHFDVSHESGSSGDKSLNSRASVLVQTTSELLLRFVQEGHHLKPSIVYESDSSDQSPSNHNGSLPSIHAGRTGGTEQNAESALLKRRARAGFISEEHRSESPKRHLIPIHYTNETPHIANHLLPNVRYDSNFVRQVKDTFPNYTDTDVANFYPHLHASEEEHSFSPPRRLSMLNQRMKERQFFGGNQKKQNQHLVDRYLPWKGDANGAAPSEFSVYTSKDLNAADKCVTNVMK